MALYEGIALIQEKQAVVLDLGTDYTKFGFTGEAAPRCIVRSEFWCTTERRYKRVHDYISADELYDNLVHMLHLLYFRHVLVNPKERKVVVVESLLTPTLFRNTLAKVLFTHYEVSGVIWADSPRLCALTLGTPIVLVVSIGAKEAEVAAVVHACVVLHALQSQPLAAHAVHAELARLLDEDHGTQLNLPDHIIEDIKLKTCFAGNILVTGGTAALPGLKARLAASLRHLVAQYPYSERLHIDEFKFHTAPAHDNACAWSGGAICGAGEGGAARAVGRDVYTRRPRLADWVCLLDNTPPHHPHREHLDI